MPTTPPKPRRVLWLAALAFAAGLATWAVAESLYVQKNATPLLAGPDGSYDPVGADLQKGDKLDILDRDGDWVKVRVGTRTGWVFSGNLAADKAGGSLADVFGGTGGTGQANTAAAKGALPAAEKVAQTKNLRTADLKRLEANRKRVTPEMLAAFQKEGQVGRFAPKPDAAKGGAQ